MTEHAHHWLLEAPGPEGTPSACRDCPAVKTWPKPNYSQLLDGRPFLVKDPLLKRAEHIYGLGNWRD